MSTIEDELKNFILSRYGSIREFTLDIGMPYSTFATILSRGIYNANMGNILKVCTALNISADGLAQGKIISYNQEDHQNVEHIISKTKKQLIQNDNLILNDHTVDKESVELLINAMDVSLEMIKKKAE